MEPAAVTVNYLIPPPDYLWKWAGDGSAAEWRDGSTVGLWMELHALLHYLGPQGLPPLGSVLMVLMACRQSAGAALEAARELAASGVDSDAFSPLSLLKPLRTVLEAVTALPEDLRSGLPARAHLLSNLFEGNPGCLPLAESNLVLKEMHTWGLPRILSWKTRLGTPARLLRDLKAFAGMVEKQDLRGLEARLRTGLEFVQINPAQLPMPPSLESGEIVPPLPLPLLRQLEEHPDRELSALASVARRMVAMFSLPRPAGFPQELPVGGISDITNRGPLDRLLLSELAADDLILTARLANNEALFFKRENPPEEPARERVILMDAGIHLWGLPRIYGVAAALGLKADGEKGKGKKREKVSGFRVQAGAGKQGRSGGTADGGGGDGGEENVRVLRREGMVFRPLPLETVEDVRSCLEGLWPDPHAAAALSGLWPAAAEDEGFGRPAGRGMDVFFLTTPGWRTPVVRALHELACRIGEDGGRFYVVTVDRSGAVEFAAHTAAGVRVAASGWIDPDVILKAPEPADRSRPEPPRAKDSLTNLPAVIRDLVFYQQYPLPFRFPAVPSARSGKLLEFAHWRVGVDTERRLMMWDPDMKHGAREIASGLPAARAYHVGAHGEEWIVISCGNGPGCPVRATAVGMKEPLRREVVLKSSHPFPVWMKRQLGAAVLGYTDKAEACSLEDGRRLDTLELPGGAKAELVIFDGRKLALASEVTGGNLGQGPGHPGRAAVEARMGIAGNAMALEKDGRDARAPVSATPASPAVLSTPVSVGFVASGTLVIRAQGGRFELSMPDFAWKPSLKTQLSAVLPFRRVSGDATAGGGAGDGGEDEPEVSVPAFYTAEWHPDCRLIFDTRGVLHLVFSDRHGRVELSFLCLMGLPVAAWTAHLPQPMSGNADWFVKPPSAPSPPAPLVPLLQRFAALARGAPPVQDWREPPEG